MKQIYVFIILFIFSFNTVAQEYEAPEEHTATKTSACKSIEVVESGMSEVESASQRSQLQRLLDGQSKAIELNGILSCLKAEGTDTASLQTQLDSYAEIINKKISPESITARNIANKESETTDTTATSAAPKANLNTGTGTSNVDGSATQSRGISKILTAVDAPTTAATTASSSTPSQSGTKTDSPPTLNGSAKLDTTTTSTAPTTSVKQDASATSAAVETKDGAPAATVATSAKTDLQVPTPAQAAADAAKPKTQGAVVGSAITTAIDAAEKTKADLKVNAPKLPLANPTPAVEDSTKNKWMSYLSTAATAVGLLYVAKKIKENIKASSGANSDSSSGNRSTASSGGSSSSGKIPKASEIPGHYTGKVTPKSNGVFGDGSWPQGDATSLVEQPEIRGLGYALGGDFDITVAADGKISGELVLWGAKCPIQSGQVPTGKYDVTFTIPGATGYFKFEAGGRVSGYVFEPGPPGHDWEGHKRGLISGTKK